MLQLAFDAAGQARPTVRQLRRERDDHLRLVDELEIPRVNLPVDIRNDLDQPRCFHCRPFARRAYFYRVLAKLGCLQGGGGQVLLFQVGRIGADKAALEAFAIRAKRVGLDGETATTEEVEEAEANAAVAKPAGAAAASVAPPIPDIVKPAVISQLKWVKVTVPQVRELQKENRLVGYKPEEGLALIK